MKYYAKLDENNVVLSSITLADDIGANEAEDVAYLSELMVGLNGKNLF